MDGVRELTRPLFAIPTHQFLFTPAGVDKKFYMDNLQLSLLSSSSSVIPSGRLPLPLRQRAVSAGGPRAPYKEKLFGTAGGR